MLSLQVLILTMASFLSGIDPPSGTSPLAMLGFEDTVTEEFLIGTWRCSDAFVRWDVTDVKEIHSGRMRNKCSMVLSPDGTIVMDNLFKPERGHWKLTEQGLVIYDSSNTGRSPQTIPVRKRGADGLWLFLPFAGGSLGVSVKRSAETAVTGEEDLPSKSKGRLRAERARRDKPVRSPTRSETTGQSWEERLFGPGTDTGAEDNP